MSGLRIIFMGTPDFAVPSLEELVKQGKQVVAVITAPDKPAGRGLKNKPSAVKETAVKYGLEVLQPENLKSPEFIEHLRSFRADLQIVVAFRMLPEVVWNMPPKGTFNLHASLLPDYRGAAPINWAIMNGEKETGATTFFLQHEIDTGNIIFQERTPISAEDTFETLYHRLMHLGAGLVVKTVNAIETDNCPSIPQQLSGAPKLAPKIQKETCEINWMKPTENVVNFIRGLSPYPAAWTNFQGKFFKIFEAEATGEASSGRAGAWETDHKTFLKVFTENGSVYIKSLQAEGKKRMGIAEFLRGNKIEV